MLGEGGTCLYSAHVLVIRLSGEWQCMMTPSKTLIIRL